MLWLDPEEVTLTTPGGVIALAGVTAVAVDRRTTRSAIEWSDDGPHVVFADAAEQRTTIRVVRRIDVGETGIASQVAPGLAATLSVRVAPARSDVGGRSVTSEVVVLSAEHDLSAKSGIEQTIVMVAVSSDGGMDPITEVEL